jgi:DnaK suppressor protein
MFAAQQAPARPAPLAPQALTAGLVEDDATEAQLLAMPEEDYMNPAQLQFFRRRLQALRASVEARAHKVVAEEREAELVLPDPADQASVEQETALEWRVRDLDRRLLKKIDDALSRIEAGDYGWCEETGDPIGIPRLLASPTATLTVEAQARLELRQRLFRN